MDREEAREKLARLVALVHGAEERASALREPLPLAHAGHVPGACGGAAGRAGAQALAVQACRAAALLQGRALLGSEALALLAAADAAAGAAPPPWSAAAPALQLAALLGRLRLGGALAPQPQPRLLRWRGALRGGAGPRPLLRCQRCGSGPARMRRTPCAACGRMCAYCEACLAMGRSRECGLLILGTSDLTRPQLAAPSSSSNQTPMRSGDNSESVSAIIENRLAQWNLSPAQASAAASALRFLESDGLQKQTGWWRRHLPDRFAPNRTHPNHSAAGHQRQTIHNEEDADSCRRFLLWAVTGAGKTEMIFPLIEACLNRGGRALIATPRRDVVLELNPRIRKAFPQRSVVTLYGGSPQRWEKGEITLATTHQLFRFYRAFDLVVIDEVDAFPYHDDPLLHYAAGNVCTPGGVNVLLSATPPAELRREAERGRLPHARVPVRFHRHPLPVPVLLPVPPVKRLLEQKHLPRRLTMAIRTSLGRGAQVFVFVPKISQIGPLVQRLREIFTDAAIDGTSSKDDERGDKVLKFRDCTIRLLVTTTILERGVTVPKSDVFIFDADSKLFDDASLVQMSGRAGRSSDDPAGNVYFCAAVRNRAQQSAIRQIRGMNKRAGRCGYLVGNNRRV
ncbi:DEAD/DEAH box helicase family protein [Paenibacillus sp. sptzw28]|nr:DEAD/DEAH box helicase family protein [Paenibacillus sp. sptzw28]